MRIFVIGYPDDLGGAGTELWHVLKLWRRHGLAVTLVPTWFASAEWRERCEAIGVATQEVGSIRGVSKIRDLGGSIVISFCNDALLRCAELMHARRAAGQTLRLDETFSGCVHADGYFIFARFVTQFVPELPHNLLQSPDTPHGVC